MMILNKHRTKETLNTLRLESWKNKPIKKKVIRNVYTVLVYLFKHVWYIMRSQGTAWQDR